MYKHAVVIPTYNERDNIAVLVEGLLALRQELKIIVVDDNSPDGTGELADDLAARHSQVAVIHRPGKLGLGTAHVAGMKVALANGTQHVVTMDADLSHHPRYVPDLLGALAHFDVVIGSRYVPGGSTRYCTLPRRTLSHGANLIARMALGLHAGDATAGYRGYRQAVLASMPFDRIVSDGYSFLIELLYRCHQQGWRIGEVPIVFENRQRGASKISRGEILKAMRTVIRLAKDRAVGGHSREPLMSRGRGQG